ncbi:MAG: type II secretion system protein N [Magnetococcales bacterium]|nr:type II secretion system protein N [Magnetococcales bacterium]
MNKRRWISYFAVGVMAFVWFLGHNPPWSRLEGWINKQIPVEIQDVTGSIWHGNVDSLQYDAYTVRHVGWRLVWSRLLGLTPTIALSIGQGSDALIGSALVSQPEDHTLSLDELRLSGRLVDLQPLLGAYISGWHGQFQVVSDSIEYVLHNKIPQISNTEISVHDLTIWGETLGRYRAVAKSSSDGEMVIRLNDEAGVVGLDGTVRISKKGRYQLSGLMTLPAHLEKRFAPLLRQLGRVKEPGRVTLNIKGTL